MQQKLFEIEESTKPKSTKRTCRNCRHRYKHEYGQMYYCSLYRQANTAYGHRKVKASESCGKFELKHTKV